MISGTPFSAISSRRRRRHRRHSAMPAAPITIPHDADEEPPFLKNAARFANDILFASSISFCLYAADAHHAQRLREFTATLPTQITAPPARSDIAHATIAFCFRLAGVSPLAAG